MLKWLLIIEAILLVLAYISSGRYGCGKWYRRHSDVGIGLEYLGGYNHLGHFKCRKCGSRYSVKL